MFECYRCKQSTVQGDRWVQQIADPPALRFDDEQTITAFIPKVRENYWHQQCVPLNLAYTEYNYTPD